MIQEVQTYHESRGAKVLWLKGCECIMTEMYKRIVIERLWIIINERVRTVLERKNVKLIMSKRMWMDLDHDKKGTNGLWSKACKWVMTEACKWVMTESVQMSYDRKGTNGRVWKIVNGRDRKVANGSWPKNCKRVVTKGCKWSWQKDCKWVVTKKVQTCRDQKE